MDPTRRAPPRDGAGGRASPRRWERWRPPRRGVSSPHVGLADAPAQRPAPHAGDVEEIVDDLGLGGAADQPPPRAWARSGGGLSSLGHHAPPEDGVERVAELGGDTTARSSSLRRLAPPAPGGCRCSLLEGAWPRRRAGRAARRPSRQLALHPPRDDAPRPRLEDEIAGARAHDRACPLLADGAGEDDEGRVEPGGVEERERAIRVEVGQVCSPRDDHVPRALAEGPPTWRRPSRRAALPWSARSPPPRGSRRGAPRRARSPRRGAGGAPPHDGSGPG